MKQLNIQLDDDRHADLLMIQDYYCKMSGTKLSQKQTIQRLLFETANKIGRREDHEEK